MIISSDEDVVPILDTVGIIGQKGLPEPNRETVRRWAAKGVRGVVLESFCVGARRYTSREAVDRFLEATKSGITATA